MTSLLQTMLWLGVVVCFVFGLHLLTAAAAIVLAAAVAVVFVPAVMAGALGGMIRARCCSVM